MEVVSVPPASRQIPLIQPADAITRLRDARIAARLYEIKARELAAE